MQIHFDNVNLDARTGPNTFARRLADELKRSKHEIVSEGTEADVSMVFIEPSGNPLAKKVIQRLDGIWTKPTEFSYRNTGIKALYERADAVVFQSEFDKTFITKHWGELKHNVVIYNGVNVRPILSFSIGALEKIRKEYDLVFVCSSNWHRQKRLKENTQLFQHLSCVLDKKCCLIVLGANPDYVMPDPHVFYAGSESEDVYMEIYSMADWMIHLAYADHCPNVVVECLSQETPIICSNVGGTKELVKNYGIVLNERSPFDNQPFDYDDPPEFDVTQLRSLPEKSLLGNHADISIERSASEYVKLLKDVVK